MFAANKPTTRAWSHLWKGTDYNSLGVNCTFEGFGQIIAKHNLRDRAHFDASMFFRKFRGTNSLGGNVQTYESSIGEDYGS